MVQRKENIPWLLFQPKSKTALWNSGRTFRKWSEIFSAPNVKQYRYGWWIRRTEYKWHLVGKQPQINYDDYGIHPFSSFTSWILDSWELNFASRRCSQRGTSSSQTWRCPTSSSARSPCRSPSPTSSPTIGPLAPTLWVVLEFNIYRCL